MILVVIGQIGAGKSELCRNIVASTGAHHVDIDEFHRDSGDKVDPADIAAIIASSASSHSVVFECTGTSRDFEEILDKIRLRGYACLVVLIDCSMETALRRVRTRHPKSSPRGGGSWTSQLRWTESRLRLVPVDYVVSSETKSASRLATELAGIWTAVDTGKRNRIRITAPKKISFSELTTFQVCPLSYRLKYRDRISSVAESEQMYLGKRLHETLAWLYAGAGRGPGKNDVIRWFEKRVMATLPRETEDSIVERLYDSGRSALAFHYDVVFREERPRTIAVEKTVRMELDADVTFVGRVDRMALDPVGVMEVIDYKASTGRVTSRPRVPEWLQIAAYSAAVLLEFNLQSVIARRLLLLSGNEERFPLAARDVPKVILSLRRWMRRLEENAEYPGNVGAHCASCQFNPVCPEDMRVPLAKNAIIREQY